MDEKANDLIRKIHEKQEERANGALEEFHRMEEELAPFIRKRRISKGHSTTGEWHKTSDLERK